MQDQRNAPHGYCQCGCGELAPIAPHNVPEKGWVMGQPKRFCRGHNRRMNGAEYIVDEETGCWVWNRALSRDGYGSIMVAGVRTRAHRAMYERLRGPIPEGLQIDHLCRNRACVNPDHLEPVTGAVNSRRGVNSKLTEDAVRAIRASSEPGVVLAQRHGVSGALISSIRAGKAWKGV